MSFIFNATAHKHFKVIRITPFASFNRSFYCFSPANFNRITQWQMNLLVSGIYFFSFCYFSCGKCVVLSIQAARCQAKIRSFWEPFNISWMVQHLKIIARALYERPCCRVRNTQTNKDTIYFTSSWKWIHASFHNRKQQTWQYNKMLNKWSWCFQENVISFHKTDILLLLPNMTNNLYIWMNSTTHMECALSSSSVSSPLYIFWDGSHVIVYFLSRIFKHKISFKLQKKFCLCSFRRSLPAPSNFHIHPATKTWDISLFLYAQFNIDIK